MEQSAQFLLTLGGILLLGLLTTTIAHRTILPRVTLLLIFGALIGHEGLDMIPVQFSDYYELIAELTLLMVGFLLGGKLTFESLRQSAREVFWISLIAALLTTALVAVLLIWAGLSVDIAILLGCIASATAPTAILDVVTEMKVDNKFSKTLLSIVAIDDLWALILFALGLSLVRTLNGGGADMDFFAEAGWEIIGAIGVGLLMGLPGALLTGRAKPGQPILTEALGLVLLCGGIALWAEVSYLIAAMTMGIVIANLAKHHDYPFHEIENIESPLMVIFFVLAGATLDFAAIQTIGLAGLMFVIGRTTGKYFGSAIGSIFGHAAPTTRRWMGLALLPQAGVPIGMALVAANQFPQHGPALLSIVISTTVLFDIIGPILTRFALKRSNKPIS